MQGSCLCGQVVYEVDQLATPIQHCACKTCRKAHAAAFNTAAGVKREHFRWLEGESLIKGFESSPGKIRYFCSNCGSQLVADKANSPYLVLRAATLDDDPGTKAAFTIWTSHQVPWLEYGEHLPAYEEWQPGK
ncbi:MAG: GFA family protein [Pseudohongiella nitratireducens]|nr:GFA family protein [Pseudohongiella nitratireducens]MDF1623137.1 GFA family protein [Pseudohongiella nitratireducens]